MRVVVMWPRQQFGRKTPPDCSRRDLCPILYLLKYSGAVDNAIEMQNGVVQGLSSAIMANKLRDAEKFLSAAGNNCGIVATWTLEHQERKLAVLMEGKRRPGTEGKAVPMHGRYICGDRPIPSITQLILSWPKASSLTYPEKTISYFSRQKF